MYEMKSIILPERSPQPVELEADLSKDELEIIEDVRRRYGKNAIEVVLSPGGRHAVKTNQYVGIIPLSQRVIKITPKIPRLSLINMTRYALDLPKILLPEKFLARDHNDYFDILALMLLNEFDEIRRKIPNHGFIGKEENLHYIKGKILFKQQILLNSNRYDRIFCRFSDLSQDIIENRIIKFTLHTLQKYPFIDSWLTDWVSKQLSHLDRIKLIPVSDHSFRNVNFTPLNEHYRNALSLCRLIINSRSISQAGEGISSLPPFLINMDTLFQNFVARILATHLGPENVTIHPTEYADLHSTDLEISPDIELSFKDKAQILLDTKYKEAADKPNSDDLAQMVLYSNSTGIKQCVLVYPAKMKKIQFDLKNDIQLYCIGFDTSASGIDEFESNCQQFISELRGI